MRRKIIKQNDTGRTIFLPIKWVRNHNLDAGDEIEITQEENTLVIRSPSNKQPQKHAKIKVPDIKVSALRSLLGAFYKAGYTEIKISFPNTKVLTEIEKTIEMLYGFEIFDITNTSCVVRAIFELETKDVKQHILRMVHTIKIMQKTINQSIQNQDYTASEQLKQFRKNVLKQRDIIQRTIVEKRLLDKDHFPYHALALHLWSIARSYNHLYSTLTTKITLEQQKFILEIESYFAKVFDNLTQDALYNNHTRYLNLMKQAKDLLKKPKQVCPIISFTLPILMAIQSSHAAILLLNYQDN